MAEVPVDKDWAWIVVVGTFINLFWTFGSSRVLGVIFVEVVRHYEASSTLASLMLTLSMLAQFLAMPFYPVLVEKVSNRSMGMFGAVCMSMAFTLSLGAPNVYIFAIVFGLLHGIGFVTVVFTTMAMLGLYFKQRLSLASGLAFTGSSLGQLVIPQLFEYLLETYGTRGAIFLLGAGVLHQAVGSAVFRPATFYTRGQNHKGTSRIKRKSLENGPPKREILANNQHENGDLSAGVVLNSIEVSDANPYSAMRIYPDLETACIRNPDHALSTSTIYTDISPDCEVPRIVGTADNMVQNNCTNSIHKDDPKDMDVEYTTTDNRTMKRDSETDSVKSVCLESKSVTAPNLRYALKTICSSRKFHCFNFGRLFSTVAFFAVTIFIAPYAVTTGLSIKQVALLLTLIGLCDLPCRPLHGWIAASGRINVTAHTGLTTLIGSTIILVCVFVPSVVSTGLIGVAVGVLYGPISCFLAQMTIDCVGLELFPCAIPMVMMPPTFVLIFVPVLFGLIYDWLETYRIQMILSAVFGIVGGAMTLLEICFRTKKLQN